MAVVVCLHHLERPSLGLAAEPLRRAGLKLDQRDLRRGDPLPDPDSIDGLITLGGQQSLREIDRYPYLVEETELLRAALERALPTLGICLGGQLLAHSQGAAISRLPKRVIGWPEVRRTPAAVDDPLFAALPDSFAALHWNEDCFAVPAAATELLARTDLGGEAIRIGEAGWALQFHPEADPPILDSWYRRPGPVRDAGVREADARELDRRRMPAQRGLAEALFGRFGRLVAAAGA